MTLAIDGGQMKATVLLNLDVKSVLSHGAQVTDAAGKQSSVIVCLGLAQFS